MAKKDYMQTHITINRHTWKEETHKEEENQTGGHMGNSHAAIYALFSSTSSTQMVYIWSKETSFLYAVDFAKSYARLQH